ncbi:hypothetical protein M409DRAFT_60867 [Zasmidium cellare ATCC 36951]|uniref:Lysophospholipase n=1 Tax=Zasmidium cellare ATCC 36951 TaxID=1080233 RepID=A0A6A6C0R6_ZASCE|nr:uncharacterized protein M409DRAFT_60867 [Zasmidium cellare ATCC 36951]KAF2159402.1 hypothetical protein M409DRAFT_60867 [Zasmidium cellare ATCC 36951]
MGVFSLVVSLVFASALTSATPTEQHLDERLLDDDYAPIPASCPNTQLVRPAGGIGSDESRYYNARKRKADTGLAAWLKKQGRFNTNSLPSVGLASSGGGYRALLEGAGVVQAFDGRDGNSSVSGLYQGLTYESGLSGGAWFLSSLAGNNWPTISSLRDNLWEDAFENSFLLPANILNSDQYLEITDDILDKERAGFDTTIFDPYGRLLSYGFLYGPDGGDEIRLSTLTSYSNFTSFNVPYPIMTALGVDRSYEGQCYPTLNATQYEFHPYEYGSWDKGVSAFANTEYMGSNLTNGRPTQVGKCITHYDNIGYVFGTSSDIFSSVCQPLEPLFDEDSPLANLLQGFINSTGSPSFQDLFGLYPNPFYKYPRSSRVNTQPKLTLVDGGVAGQNVPIWPFIQPGRTVDVLITGDNSADTNDNYPNGTELHQTYLNARAAGLTKMPYIPDADTFVAQGLNKRAAFFGCPAQFNTNSSNANRNPPPSYHNNGPNNNQPTILIINLPNVPYIYPSGQSTLKIQYSKAETRAMIANGNAIATQNGEEGWAVCLACAVKYKDGLRGLPRQCGKCFERYCYFG